MCINPSPIKSGVSVACRKCWQCRENRISDWIGRCIAESKTAKACHSVTLTYGRVNGQSDHQRAAVLTYSDVQKYIKRLRRNGYPCKYFAVGEYGSKKGRSHWHLILFWLHNVPPHQLSTRDNDIRFFEPHWSGTPDHPQPGNGVSHWEACNAASIRYVCKYIQKDVTAAMAQGHLGMSKKPPLGREYFEQLAMNYVKQGLSPQTPEYSFPEVMRGGEIVKFYMKDVTLDHFLQAFVDLWARHRGGDFPASDLVYDYLDRSCKIDPDNPILIERDQRFIKPEKTEGEKRWLEENQGAGNVRLKNSPRPEAGAAYRVASGR